MVDYQNPVKCILFYGVEMMNEIFHLEGGF